MLLLFHAVLVFFVEFKTERLDSKLATCAQLVSGLVAQLFFCLGLSEAEHTGHSNALFSWALWFLHRVGAL